MPITLVTGGAGFIGAHVTRELHRMGHRVVVLDDLSGGYRENVHPDAVFVDGSVTDAPLVERLFAEHRFDYVYHLAAYAAEGLSHFVRRFNYTNNVIGSVNLINESVKHRVKCFVFTSSIAVYGTLTPPLREDMPPAPVDPYGIAKFAVEQDLHASRAMFGLDYVIFRPHNVYGELQNIGDRYRNVVGIFMNQLMQGQPLTVFGDGAQTRAFSYIGDVAPVIAHCIENPSAVGEIFNIGAEATCSVNDLARETMAAMGVHGAIRYLPERYEARHAHADHSKLTAVFGPRQETPLAQGLRRMACWAKDAGARTSRPFEAIEIRRGLPAGWLDD